MICLKVKQFAYFNHTLFGLHPPPPPPPDYPQTTVMKFPNIVQELGQIFKDRTNPAYILPPLTHAKKREITFSFLADAAGSSSFFRFFGGKGCVPSPSATAQHQTLPLNLAIQKVLILKGSKAVMRVQCACHRRLLRRT